MLSDPVVISAIVTVAGMLGVAVVSAIVQVTVTRRIVDAEHKKTVRQLAAEANIRTREARRERLHLALLEVVTLCDPEVFDPGRDRAALNRAVHQAQLILDIGRPDEARVNGALNRLALDLAGWRNEPPELGYLMSLHSDLVDSSQRLLAAMDRAPHRAGGIRQLVPRGLTPRRECSD